MSSREKSENSQSADRFLQLLQESKKGRFKLYIGLAAGVGKTYRMLQETRELLAHGVDAVIGYVETHGRAETEAQLQGLPLLPRRSVFYKGKMLEEFDLQAVLQRRPEVVMVDELAHTNVPGSEHEKRWQDVEQLIDAGISVISAVNIQHVESLNYQVQKITGVEVSERVPDRIVKAADEIVNIDLTIDELLNRLTEGKIYERQKVEAALKNFFQKDNLLQLRELALREVSFQLMQRIDKEVTLASRKNLDKLLACINTNEKAASEIIRKTSRLADHFRATWYVVYVQTPKESMDAIGLAKQRHLINNLQLATQLGGQIIRLKGNNVAEEILQVARNKQISLLICGATGRKSVWNWFKKSQTRRIIRSVSSSGLDLDIYLVSV
ncbi:universal stress protein [Pontibacter sp. SGAir0037]|uniref:universal stress protein n=1 Tax=Pontibacter sp. SGAir0037 TaxID=2571030 RepID=UPI0010CCCB75|nr:universal stress protein [Pontibacter sp. SGAir0037]QCR21806.1 histidine kinase [Pontibacter sp. SGAir0037]